VSARHGWLAWLDITLPEDHLRRTTDGGRHWTELPEIDTGFWKRLRFFDANVGYGLQSTSNGYQFGTTTDGGKHWRFGGNVPLPAGLATFFFLDPRIGWLAGGGATNNAPGLLRTTDGGATWQQSRVPTGVRGYPSDLFFVDADRGWTILWNGSDTATSTLLRTDDGGRTWSEDRSWITSAPDEIIRQIRFVSTNIGVLTALTYDDEPPTAITPCGDSNAPGSRPTFKSGLLTTLDGGRTWTRSQLAERTGSCQVMEDNVWCTSERDLLKIRIRP